MWKSVSVNKKKRHAATLWNLDLYTKKTLKAEESIILSPLGDLLMSVCSFAGQQLLIPANAHHHKPPFYYGKDPPSTHGKISVRRCWAPQKTKSESNVPFITIHNLRSVYFEIFGGVRKKPKNVLFARWVSISGLFWCVRHHFEIHPQIYQNSTTSRL